MSHCMTMFNEIVVPLDGSDLSATSLPIAYAMAAASNAKVSVFAYAAKEQDLASLQVRVEDQVAVTNALYNGPSEVSITATVAMPSKAIDLELQDEISAREKVLVCMSTHGRGRSAAFTGSVATSLMSRVSTPVMLIGPDCNVTSFNPNGTLIVSIDSSHTSESVIPAATWWAREFGSPLEFVTVLEPNLKRATGAGSIGESIQVERLAHTAQTELARPVSFEVLHSKKPADALLERAKSTEASLLAMATHGSSGLSRLANGSVTSSVVRHAKCPVLVLGPEN